MAVYGWARKSLNGSGAVAAVLVGFITFYSGYVFGLVLISFFLSSSRITKVRSAEKKAFEDGHKEGGQRNYVQVFCNSAPALCYAMCYYHWFGHGLQPLDSVNRPVATFLQCAFVAHYACCAGDTWASELGILDSGGCRLITTCRRVPRGTNGGMSVSGTFWSLVGGVFIGIVFVWLNTFPGAMGLPETGLPTPNEPRTQYDQWIPGLILAGLSGLGGSCVDSALGATLQFSGYDRDKRLIVSKPGPNTTHITGWNVLSNDSVNLLSALITSLIAGYLSRFAFVY